MKKDSFFYKRMTFFTVLLVVILSIIFELVFLSIYTNELIDNLEDYMEIELVISETGTELFIEDKIDIIKIDSSIINTCEKIEVHENNKIYYSKNNCIIKKMNNELVLACKNSIIPHEVKSIGFNAFKGLNFNDLYYEGTLEEWCNIDFNSTYVGEYAEKIWFVNQNNEFYCPEEIIIPDSVTRISKYCFDYFNQLKSITFHDKLEFVEEFSFWNCKNLKKIVFNGEISIDAFEPNALIGMANLEEFHVLNAKKTLNLFPLIDTTIDKFYYDGTLEEWLNLDIYTNKYQIKGNRKEFYLKDNNDEYYLLSDLVIPTSISTIKNFAFANFDSIKSVNIHKEITSIGANAFLYCDNLTDLVIEKDSTLTYIGHLAFMACPLSENLILPDTLNSLGNSPFEDCANIRYVKMPYIKEQYLGLIFGGALDNITKFELVYNEYSGTLISSEYFNNLSNASVIILDDEFETIDSYAFRNCNSLKDIYLPKNLQLINLYAFPEEVKLDNVYLNCSLETFQRIINLNFLEKFRNAYNHLYINVDGVYEKVIYGN